MKISLELGDKFEKCFNLCFSKKRIRNEIFFPSKIF